MVRSTAAPAALALLAAFLAQRPRDHFVEQHGAAVAKSPLSDRFSIAFADDRRTFHPGEAIPLVFSYDRLAATPYNYEHFPHLGLAHAVLDHEDGTVYPLADYDRAGHSGNGGILAGVRGCFVAGVPPQMDASGSPLPQPPEKPCPATTFTVYLNQDVRFDRPGHFRFYVVDDHVSFLERSNGQAPVPSLVSNILELDIADTDAGWERRTAAAAIAQLDEPFDDAVRLSAARTLGFLGRGAALDEMIARLAGTPEPSDRVRGQQTWYFVRGLYGAPDRAGVVARMRRRAASRQPPIASPLFSATLKELEGSRK
jgi:hypothetical protein